ncbi:MAG: 5-(carboxyamino)imidazole ribonucleotide mutase [Bacillota bacterium]|nr:5-(carboxyamino)imidazole ribonucleotide mutase [Bacillota bacterium]
MKKVAIVMGSASDYDRVRPAVEVLREAGVPTVTRVLSAHRTPEEAGQFAATAAADGFGVIIAAAGKAAHLAGALAARTTLPVIGIPIRATALDGMDALLSTVQMPQGIPVATVAIDGAANAAILALQILALGDPVIAARLLEMRERIRQQAIAADTQIQARIAADFDANNAETRSL